MIPPISTMGAWQAFGFRHCSVRLHDSPCAGSCPAQTCLSVLYVSMWLSLSRSMRRTAMRQGPMRTCRKRRQKII